MNKLIYSLSIFILLLISCNNKSENSESLEVDTISTPLPSEAEVKPIFKKDTIVKEITIEDPIMEGYRFGMTVSEWNEFLAKKVDQGIVKSLNESGSLNFTENYISYAYKGNIKIDFLNTKANTNKGYDIIGLFIRPSESDKTFEIFKRNGIIINEPILYGVKKVFYISDDEFNLVINKELSNNSLSYVAGYPPNIVLNRSLGVDDFSDPVENGLDKFTNESLSKNTSSSYTTKTLYNNNNVYAVFEVTETRSATIQRNGDYEVISVDNAYVDYKLVQRIFSKKIGILNIEDYMTEEQKIKFRDSMKTIELRNKALK